MLTRALGLFVLIAISPTVGSAQEKWNDTTLDEKFGELAEEFDQLESQDRVLSKTQLELSTIQKELREKQIEMADNFTDLMSSVQQMREETAELKDRLQQTLDEHERILGAISTTDSNSQQPILGLKKNMESEEFRNELDKAVHKTIRTHGEFTVSNKMSSPQQISINGRWYDLAAHGMPNDARTFRVPVGTVTTRLPGKRLQNWTVGAPDYEDGADIVPDSSPTLPPTYIYPVGPPTYVSPPPLVYVSSF